jgi:hypothetical protein
MMDYWVKAPIKFCILTTEYAYLFLTILSLNSDCFAEHN